MSDSPLESLDEVRSLPESKGDLSKDTVFSLLSNARRRYVIEAMLRRDEGCEFQHLVRTVARREFGESPDYRQRKRIYVSLRQTHLPALDDAGVVRFDRDRGHVDRGENFGVTSTPIRLMRGSRGLLPAVPIEWVDVPPAASHRVMVFLHHLTHYGV